jgi:glycosyltransferase involved in cell wall biosynthesis
MVEVSVIIPIYGPSASLRECLRALQRQSYPADKFEVIVVDNGASDDLQTIRAEFPDLRWLKEPSIGSYAARNRGVAEARGRVIAFTDADCVPDPDWLREGVNALADQEATIIGGRIRYLDPADRPLNLYEKIEEKYFYLDKQEQMIARWRMAATANIFVLREVFGRVGDFDATLKSTADGDWSKRAVMKGEILRYAGSAVVFHPRRGTLEAVSRKYIRISMGLFTTTLRDGKNPLRILAGLYAYSLLDPRVHFAPATFRGLSLRERLRLGVVIDIISVRTTIAKLRIILGREAPRS